MTLYALDMDHVVGNPYPLRSERFDVLDAASGAVLASETIGMFKGEYVSFTISGNVTIRVTNLTPPGGSSNAVVSGIFFGGLTGRVTTITVDSNDNLTSITDPDAAVTLYGYTSTLSNHLLTTETNPDSHTATAHYNSFAQVMSETLFDGSSTTGVAAVQGAGLVAYGDSGTLSLSLHASVTDPDGHVTTLTYGRLGEPIAIGDPATGGATSSTVNRQGLPVAMTDEYGFTTTYTYDPLGSITSVTRLAGDLGDTYGGGGTPVTETIAYGVDEVPTSITDFNGNTTTYTLDGDGNVLSEVDPVSGHEEEWTYNSAGQVLTATDGNGHTTTNTYDSLGRLETVTDANDHTTTYSYDYAGNVATVTDPNGHTVTYTYDAMDRLLTTTEPSGGGTTTNTYDAAGNLRTVTDPDSNTTTYTYNAENEVATETSPTGGVTTYTYDGQGNLTETVDPDGHTIDYAYDADNRPTTETWENPLGGTPVNVITTTYDKYGNVSQH